MQHGGCLGGCRYFYEHIAICFYSNHYTVSPSWCVFCSLCDYNHAVITQLVTTQSINNLIGCHLTHFNKAGPEWNQAEQSGLASGLRTAISMCTLPSVIQIFQDPKLKPLAQSLLASQIKLIIFTASKLGWLVVPDGKWLASFLRFLFICR